MFFRQFWRSFDWRCKRLAIFLNIFYYCEHPLRSYQSDLEYEQKIFLKPATLSAKLPFSIRTVAKMWVSPAPFQWPMLAPPNPKCRKLLKFCFYFFLKKIFTISIGQGIVAGHVSNNRHIPAGHQSSDHKHFWGNKFMGCKTSSKNVDIS